MSDTGPVEDDGRAAPGATPSRWRNFRFAALSLLTFFGVILAVGALSVRFSGAITRAELADISEDRWDATAPPPVPQGASDTRQMTRALRDELDEATEQVRHLRFRNGPDWSTWTAVASDPDEASRLPTSAVVPTAPGTPYDPTGTGIGDDPLLDLALSATVTASGSAGTVPADLEAPEPPTTTGTFDLAEVTVLDDLAAADFTARRATDLHDAVRGWVVVSGRSGDVTVAMDYVTGETGSVVATVVLDGAGELVEVQR